MPEPTIFGRRLKELREIRGWTQEQLAERAKVPAAMISHFETGVRGTPSADNLVKLANALEVTIDYLLGRSDEPQVASSRFAAVLRSLAKASAETMDAAVDVVETLVEREQKRRGTDESTRADDPEVRKRRPG